LTKSVVSGGPPLWDKSQGSSRVTGRGRSKKYGTKKVRLRGREGAEGEETRDA